MSILITVVIVLLIAGIVLWLINTYIPMAAPIKTILNIVVIVFLVIWILSVFGLLGPLQHLIHTP